MMNQAALTHHATHAHTEEQRAAARALLDDLSRGQISRTACDRYQLCRDTCDRDCFDMLDCASTIFPETLARTRGQAAEGRPEMKDWQAEWIEINNRAIRRQRITRAFSIAAIALTIICAALLVLMIANAAMSRAIADAAIAPVMMLF